MNLSSTWQYRGFITGSVAREFKIRYQTSFLGTAWAVINPLSMVIIYMVVFSRLMKAKLPGIENTLGYGIYLCAGILCWNTFTEVANRCQTVFLENANLIRKMSFPRICLPIIVVLSAGINFAILFAIILLFVVVTKGNVGFSLLAIVPLFFLQISFATGLGIFLGVLNVFFRDVGQLFGIVFQFWFWLTPIVYPLSVLPDRVQKMIFLNPVTPLVQAYQGLFIFGSWPKWTTLVPTMIVAMVLITGAFFLYRKCSADMVDEL